MIPMLIGMAVSALGQMSAKSKANVEKLDNQARGSAQEQAAFEGNTAENKAIAEANLQNVIRTGYKVGLLNVQRARAKKQAMQQGVDLSRRGLAAMSTATANAAASGTIGNSVQAVQVDIQQRLDEAGADLGDQYAQEEANFDVQLHDILLSGEDAQRAAATTNIQQTPKANLTSTGEVIGGVIGAAAASYASSYLASSMSLGTKSSSGGSTASPGSSSQMGIGDGGNPASKTWVDGTGQIRMLGGT